MNSTVSAAQITEYLSSHLADVFDMMLSLKASPAPANESHHAHGDRVTGAIGLAGDAVTGSVYLHITSAFAVQAAAAMLGMAPEEITGTAEVNDVVGEVTNMLAGGLKSWLCDSGAACALTTPAVIRGTSFEITPKPGVEIILLGFDCGEARGMIEVHIKFS